jgi:hypothetical protein
MRAGTMTKEIQAPTAEQLGAFDLAEIVEQRRGGGTVTIGKAYRRRRMIDVLFDAKVLSLEEHKALHVYRHNADLADRSPLRDSIATLMMVRGSGDPPSVVILNAIRSRDDCERAAGSLRGILRAVAIDDVSLPQWVASQGFARERRRERNGRVDTWLEADQAKVKLAKIDIRVAAQRVQAELDA